MSGFNMTVVVTHPIMDADQPVKLLIPAGEAVDVVDFDGAYLTVQTKDKRLSCPVELTEVRARHQDADTAQALNMLRSDYFQITAKHGLDRRPVAHVLHRQFRDRAFTLTQGVDHWDRACWQITASDDDTCTYQLNIRHDWPGEPDQFGYAIWIDGEEHLQLPAGDWQAAYLQWKANMPNDPGDFPYDRLNSMQAEWFAEMEQRWHALQMIIDFQVTH